jgi:hypothetical protein
MASLKKRKGSKVWQAQYYVPDENGGLRQVRKSTGKTRKSEALLAAAEMERAAQGIVKSGTDKAALAKAVLAEMGAEIELEKFTTLSARKHLARLLAIATGEDMQATRSKAGRRNGSAESPAIPARRQWHVTRATPTPS